MGPFVFSMFRPCLLSLVNQKFQSKISCSFLKDTTSYNKPNIFSGLVKILFYRKH